MGLSNFQNPTVLYDRLCDQRVADMSGTAPGGTPADFAKFIADDTEKWAGVVSFFGTSAN